MTDSLLFNKLNKNPCKKCCTCYVRERTFCLTRATLIIRAQTVPLICKTDVPVLIMQITITFTLWNCIRISMENITYKYINKPYFTCCSNILSNSTSMFCSESIRFSWLTTGLLGPSDTLVFAEPAKQTIYTYNKLELSYSKQLHFINT